MTTEETIKKRINDRLTIPANLLEGGFSQQIVESVAYELANIQDTDLTTIADNCFVTTAQGEWLDKVGADYGITRRQDVAASVYLEIKGTQGATINSNIKAVYNNLVFTVQEYKVINSSGTASVKAKCETLGTVGNVPANTITEFLTDYDGLTSVNNLEAAYDGFDEEDDETYRQRILDYLAEDATNSNEAQYEKWAREVEGVQKAVVKDAATMGAGNVGVYISAIGDVAVSDDLINSVKTHIESVEIINATVIVKSLDYLDINVAATVVLKDGYTVYDTKDELTEKLKVYLPTVDNTVSYFNINNLLFDCVSVEDVTVYTLNGGETSINITDTQYPVTGEVTISESA